MSIRLTAKNYKSLRRLDWQPEGVCALAGPNGAGKTTTLWTPEVLRLALESDLVHALDYAGGRGELRHWAAPAEEPIEVSLSVGDATWTLRPDGTASPHERFVRGGVEVLARDAGARSVRFGEESMAVADQLGLRTIKNIGGPTAEAVRPVLDLVRGYRVHGDHALRQLRENGSPASSDDRLNFAGTNAFATLLNWSTHSEHEHRWTFLNERLKRAFPELFRRFDFEIAGNIVSATIRTPRQKPVRPNDWPNGFFAMLLHLCAIAGTEPHGAVALDEPETSLHPALIRFAVECFRDWSAEHEVTVLLSTHSPVVLDCFNETPDQVFVMEPGKDTLPVRLDTLRSREWLAHFALGTLYEDLKFGAPPEVPEA